MKILSASQIREADAYTIKHEPVLSTDLMERAAQVFCRWFIQLFHTDREVHLYCGPGNNGGDGLAIARILSGRGFVVYTYIVSFTDNYSKDYQINKNRLTKLGNVDLSELRDGASLSTVKENSIIIDAIFGSGLSRPVEGWPAKVIAHLNDQPATRVAVDIPSGVYADKAADGMSFHAHYTFSFERPKLSFFFPENAISVGQWYFSSIGLSKPFFTQTETNYHLVAPSDIHLKPRKCFTHKGTYGHALIMAGSYGKMGAAVLSARAALHAGSGLVSTYIPRCGYNIMQTAFPEGMCITDMHQEILTHLPEEVEKHDAIGIGPGIGQEIHTANMLHLLLKTSEIPLVLDADALNIIGANPDWLSDIPEHSILTPHPKEFERLFHPTNDYADRLELLRTKAQEFKLIIVLKGAYTATALPDGNIWFNSTGNPGMATAGSGDVLTGIITGLLAQGFEPWQAAIYGVYIHGLAGDVAAEQAHERYITAGDIITGLAGAFNRI